MSVIVPNQAVAITRDNLPTPDFRRWQLAITDAVNTPAEAAPVEPVTGDYLPLSTFARGVDGIGWSGTLEGGGVLFWLDDVTNAGGGTLQKTAFDAKGRMSGTSAATTSDLAEGTNLYYTDARARTAVIAATIVDGDTTHAPSGDAVFDALELKAPKASPTFTGTVTTSDLNITGTGKLNGSFGSGGVTSNFAAGSAALNTNSTGNNNSAVGAFALFSNTTGSRNLAVGAFTLYSNTTGSYNSAIGERALYSNVTGNYNNAIGANSLFYTTGSYNSAIGERALRNNTTGSYNNAIGDTALYDLGSAQTAGAFNIGTSYTIATVGTTDFTLIGAASNTVGVTFTATGAGTGTGTATPNGTNNNTAIGYNAGRGIVYGVNNTIIGANVTGLAAGLSNNIIIADGAGNQRIKVDSSGNLSITAAYKVGSNQVVGARDTGWSAMTGTGSKASIAAAAAGTASAAYVQTELQDALNRIAALEARLKSLDAALIAHGLIGT